MPRREGRDQATLLSEKARSDEIALTKLVDDVEVPDDLIGFHAQQAVEKLLKAVLAARDVPFPRTHDLALLLLLAADNAIHIPPEPDRLRSLTPWAAQFRYDQEPPNATLDRPGTADLVIGVRRWADAQLDDA